MKKLDQLCEFQSSKLELSGANNQIGIETTDSLTFYQDRSWNILQNNIILFFKLVKIIWKTWPKLPELAEPYKYDEINFNCGCPSPRVAGHGCFGARLMLDPKAFGLYKESLLLSLCQ
ncbi:unnamed protein product [Prunus armeniaca]|uniref:DUS-like FMN-binding domain-containing protein n=1 Tax=Prunus armeniaca TaxID=36596 RepID=A0A6J5WE03_PRUAR|nr:unnamed protein product [Prunus armeniaca]